MSSPEIMTIIISFHQSHYRVFKNYYLGYVTKLEVLRFLKQQR